MLSLNNAFDKKDLENFEKKILNFLSLQTNKNIEFKCRTKNDGISASLFYKMENLSRDFPGETV